mmetsp:Transcript_77223/g.165550  ORF Transcript_77223/g.165550 Transcript_77223/m.165550 type:complete len:200 (-) Transcript_77223:218-817(-)
MRQLGIVFVGQAPLIADEHGSGFENAQDLAVDLQAVRCVACGLDGIGAIEVGVGEGQLHEVGLNQLHLIADALPEGNDVTTVNLEVIDGDGLYLRACEARDVARRPADATTTIKEEVVFVNAETPGQVILMAEDGLAEALTLTPVGEVEARTPTPLIELRRQVVVGVDKLRIIRAAVVCCPIILLVVAVDLVVLLRARE